MKTLVNDTQKKTILSIVTGLALAIASPAFAQGVEVQAVAKKPAVKAAPAKPATADDRDLSQVAPPETPEAAAQPAQAAAEVHYVNSDPTIVKSFNPSSIAAGEFVTYAISFNNPNNRVAKLTAPYREKLPAGLVILGTATTTCGGNLTAQQGTTKIELKGGRILPFDTCEILVGVTSDRGGVIQSRVLRAELQTDRGNNGPGETVSLEVKAAEKKGIEVVKTLNPEVLEPNQFATLTIALTNPNATDLAAPYSDSLPEGVVILGSSSTTCKGNLTAKPGTSKVSLSGAKLKGFTSCQILLGVTAKSAAKKSAAAAAAPQKSANN